MNIKGILVRGIHFGQGTPKICVPIVGRTKEEIMNQAADIMEQHPDCVEFRADCYDGIWELDNLPDVLRSLREILKDTVLLFTFRSKQEGGQQDITVERYKKLCECACDSGFIDMLDVEAYMERNLLKDMVLMAHKHHVVVIGSSHDFIRTSTEEEMLQSIWKIDNMGADIPKLAVTPNEERDVLNLLSATLRYHEEGGEKPLITISMGEMGGISRLSGELVGSVMTFATIGQKSAPGQIPFNQVQEIVKQL